MRRRIEQAVHVLVLLKYTCHGTPPGLVLFYYLRFFFFNDTATTEIYTELFVGSVRWV